YWSEVGHGRCDLLALLVAHLAEHRWGAVIDTGWSDWDVRVDCPPWAVVDVTTAQEDHGGSRHLVRVRYRVRPSGLVAAAALMGLGCLAVAAAGVWPAAAGAAVAAAVAVAGWWRGLRRASGVA